MFGGFLRYTRIDSQPIILQEAAGNGTAFRLRFSNEAEALAFVCAFVGRLIQPGASAAYVESCRTEAVDREPGLPPSAAGRPASTAKDRGG